ncbi:pyruvate formate lyase family protein [Shigella flexneri]
MLLHSVDPQIESNGHSVSFARMDQYLYPYYRRDVELDQSLDREQAIELLHSCWLKLLEVNKIRSGSALQSLCRQPAVSERHHRRTEASQR